MICAIRFGVVIDASRQPERTIQATGKTAASTQANTMANMGCSESDLEYSQTFGLPWELCGAPYGSFGALGALWGSLGLLWGALGEESEENPGVGYCFGHATADF